MAKKLKVSFAMGGGVSLGSFSGAALTEILKLLILYGQDEDGNLYDEIVLDSFSGASAGAISLAIMMRALMDYESVLEHLPDSKSELIQQLEKDYGKSTIDTITQQGKLDQLLAATVSQRLQEILWVENISIEALFGDDKPQSKRNLTSLLERDYLAQSTADYLLKGVEKLKEKTPEKLREDIQILAKDRVLFACSLTNFSSISRTKKFNEDPIIKSFERSFNDYDHKELRIVDFQFQPGLQSEAKWLSIGLDNQADYNIGSVESWSMFASSAIACGAFPVAFEPAVLERRRKELYLPEDADQIEGSTMKFAYIDGGTFNNEPISEAFKLANYLDLNSNAPKESYDRIVFFVDPIVSSDDPGYALDLLKKYNADYKGLKKGFGLKKITPKKVSGNIMGYSSRLAGIMRKEGVVKEGLKINKFIKKYQQRNLLVSSYMSSQFELQDEDLTKLLYVLIKYTEDKISNRAIPPGTANKIEFLSQKYARVLHEKFDQDLSEQDIKEFRSLLEEVEYCFQPHFTDSKPTVKEDSEGLEQFQGRSIDMAQTVTAPAYDDGLQEYHQTNVTVNMHENAFENLMANATVKGKVNQIKGKVKAFFTTKGSQYKSRSLESSTQDTQQDFRKALSFILLDLLMGTFDKDINAYLIAITPMNFHSEKPFEELSTIPLPGGEFEAFAGFSSLESRKIAFDQGRLCSLGVLERGSFRKQRALDVKDSQDPQPVIEGESIQSLKDKLTQRIKTQFSENGNYLKKYQSVLLTSLKAVGGERLYHILLDGTQVKFPLNLVLLILSPIGILLFPIIYLGVFITNLFYPIPNLIGKLLDGMLVNPSFKRMTQFTEGSECHIDLELKDIGGKKARCTFFHQPESGAPIKLAQFKIGVNSAQQSIDFLVPYIDHNGKKQFYFSKYQERNTEGAVFEPEKVVNKVVLRVKGLNGRKRNIEVALPPLHSIEKCEVKLKYFINPVLKIKGDNPAFASHTQYTIEDVSIPLEETILALFNR